MKRFPALAVLVLASITGFLLSTPVALANTLSLSLASPNQPLTPGGTLSYFATVSAPSSNVGLEYLNGDSFSVSPPSTLNDSAYLSTFPLDLSPGQTFTGLLFTLTFPSLTKIGDYPGLFSITGGTTPSATSVLATVTFDPRRTPEPSSWMLFGTGLVVLAVAMGRRLVAVRSSQVVS
ncbi:MAG TPA: PEP-CTERM sorting domain-containing protein [Acidobacteriaceae bacterium]|jgi:hypothetical protein